MNKFFLLLIAIFTTAGAFGAPFSYSNAYVAGFGGLNIVNSNLYDPGYAVGVAAGCRFSNLFRLEVEGAFRENTFGGVFVANHFYPSYGSVKTATVMTNGLIELHLFNNTLVPHLGGGCGAGWTRFDCAGMAIKSTYGSYYFDPIAIDMCCVAYQGIAGLTLCACKKTRLAFEYRLLNGSRMNTNHTADIRLESHF